MKESKADMQKENRNDEGNRNKYADTAFYPVQTAPSQGTLDEPRGSLLADGYEMFRCWLCGGTAINIAGIGNCSLCFFHALSKVKDLLRISML